MAACGRHVFSFAKIKQISLLSTKWTAIFTNHVLRRCQTTNPIRQTEEEANEYSKTPEYPPCFDTSLEGRERTRRQNKYDKIRNAPTVEEKYLLLAPFSHTRQIVNILRADNVFVHYNTLPFIKHATRTHFVEGLPDAYEKLADAAMVDAIVEYITPFVKSAVQMAFFNYQIYPVREVKESHKAHLKTRDKIRSQMVIDNVHKAISVFLCQELDYLKECQVDYNPRCESFWLAGGFPVLPPMKRLRKRAFLSIDPDAPMDHLLQYIGFPYMQIRNEDPLQQLVELKDSLCFADEKYHNYEASPNSAGFFHNFRYPSSVPGVWPGDPCGFGTMSYHTREQDILTSAQFGRESVQKTLHSYAILASFGWINGLAFNKGFTSFQDTTYPITTQTVLTNGQLWSFYAYQLNTLSFSSDFIKEKFCNVCWGTNELKLFDSVTDGEIHGFNSDVLKLLVRFYLNRPVKRVDLNLTPYLKKDVKYLDDEWQVISKRFKWRNSNRPFDNRIVERNWFTKIYKEWFNTRLDKLR